MAIVTETIRVVVSGANPQTFTRTVNVDTTTGAGTGPLSIPLTGVNAGTDTIQTFMDSHSLSSNQSTLVWQAVNGPIANGNITIDTYFSNGTRGWPGSLLTGAGSFGNTYPHLNAAPGANSLVFNQVIPNYPIPGFNNQPTNVGLGGGYKLCPMVVVTQTATGQFTGVSGGPGLAIAGTNDGANGHADNGSDHHGYLLNVYGTFVVKTPGTYTFYGNMCNEGSLALWIPGVTVSSRNGNNSTVGGGNNPFPAASPKFGYTPLCLAEIDTNESAPVTSAYINFPTAGSYPFEAVFNQHDFQQFSGDNNGYFQITYLAGTQNQSISSGNSTSIGLQPFPVAIATAPPAGSTPTGSLRLTPVGGAVNLVTQGQGTNLTLTVQNVPYTSIPYVPILEGTSGFLTITNSGVNFTFPTFNGNVVDTTAAATDVFAITANNQSVIAGLFSVTPTGVPPAPFRFNYNGGAFSFATPAATISSSQVTVTADDIAWFDPTGTKFDTYNGGAGSTGFSFDVDYMTKPTVASVSPSNLNANGTAQAVQINLDKAMSPMQQGLYGTGNSINISGSLTGGATFGSVFTPILNSGFLVGWSTSIVPPTSSTNGTITMSLNVNGTLTYLSGNTFVTTNVSYINGPVATLNTLGGFVAPVGVSLTTNPSSTSLSPGGGTPTNTPQPIRRATWGAALGSQLGGSNSPGNVITIYGEGRGTLFPSTLVPGAQVTLAGFLNPFPNGSGTTGQGGSTTAGPSIPININGVYTVNVVTTAIVGGSESVPVFTVTAPSSQGGTRSFDWGSSVNPPNSGWTFTAPASSAGVTDIIGTEYTYDNPSSCTVQFFKKFISSGTRVNLGAPTSTPTSQITTTVGGKTVYQKTYQTSSSSYFPAVSGTTTAAGQLNLGFDVTDNTTGLTTTYQSTTVYQEQVTIISGGGGGGGGGCPALEMFVDDWHQVADVFVGMGVETLAGECSSYIDNPITTETREVQAYDFDTQVCYRLRAENGCEVIVSDSTPVPTRETIEKFNAGLDIAGEAFANEVRVGMHVITEIDTDTQGVIGWSPLVEVECVGMRRVARVNCGGRNFAAGTKPGRYIYTHNLQAIVK